MTQSTVADMLERMLILDAAQPQDKALARFEIRYRRNIVQVCLPAVRQVTLGDSATYAEMQGMLNALISSASMMFSIFVPIAERDKIVKQFAASLEIAKGVAAEWQKAGVTVR